MKDVSSQAEDDHDDLLAAAVAAVEAQQKEAVKAGRKKFGLLGRSAATHKAAPRSSEDEQGHVVSSHTAKVQNLLTPNQSSAWIRARPLAHSLLGGVLSHTPVCGPGHCCLMDCSDHVSHWKWLHPSGVLIESHLILLSTLTPV